MTGKENILFSIAAAAAGKAQGIVEEVVYPDAGGLEVLLDLVREFESKGPTYRQARQRSFKASYTNHYRAGLIQILEALEFRSNNTAHRPVLEALELIKQYKAEHSPTTLYYHRGEHVPVDGVIPRDLADLLYKTDKRGRRRVQRTVYECGVFQTLRDKLRCKEIWVVGADEWRNPDEDLPADFDQRRAESYAKLRKPLDPKAFTAQMRADMAEALADLNDHLPELDWVDIRERPKAGPIILTDLDAVPEPRNLRRLKAAIRDRWGTVPLLDMLTETALRTSCLDAFTPAGTRGDIAAATLFQRLLLTVYAYGTNTGIRAVAGGEHGHSEDELRYVRRPYITVESCQAGRPDNRQRDVRRPPGVAVGRGLHRGGVRLDSLQGVGPEHLHRVALALPERNWSTHGFPVPSPGPLAASQQVSTHLISRWQPYRILLLFPGFLEKLV